MKKHIFIILIFFFVSSESFAQNEFTIGYIANSLFHPLINVSGGMLSAPKSNEPIVTTWVKNAFQTSGLKIPLSDPIKYTDVYTEEPGYYSKASLFIFGTRGNYYANLEKPLIDLRFRNREKVIRGFYRFFSKDEWGRHFIPKDLLNQSVNDISKQSGVVVHYVTDLDSDSMIELWISYKLMYGEIGNMVYEQTEDSTWTSVSNHCYNCD